MDIKSIDIGQLVETIRDENPVITGYLLDYTLNEKELIEKFKEHYSKKLESLYPSAWNYYNSVETEEFSFFNLTWQMFAFIRMMDYLDYEGSAFVDGNLHGQEVTSSPILLLRELIRGNKCDVNADFVLDMLHLLRQLNGKESQNIPTRAQVLIWMDKHTSGLDESVISWRKENKKRIISLLIKEIEEQKNPSVYKFEPDLSLKEKESLVNKWWDESKFHLKHAIRSWEKLNEYLNFSVSEKRLNILKEAQSKGIPIFATPYFLSLIDVREQTRREVPFNDEALLSYLFYSQDLLEEFNSIVAWEKEDIVELGKPNEAGWILPTHHIHRRYPNVAIFIPDTMGRACGGLCAYCQRMYDFQKGRFNFNLDLLRPKKSWDSLLHEVMSYFRSDPYLEDILITGGDALMSSVSSLKKILDAVLQMAIDKKKDNETRLDHLFTAEMKRVRLGTKLPIYLPQRITKELVGILKEFRIKASEIGIKQCVIQTHFSSAMEITPESEKAIKMLLKSGWAVTNQEVFTVASSRRGHSAKLKKVLNDIGILPYYTFTVKGYKENREVFANNPRSMQQQIEEKSIGRVDVRFYSTLRSFINDAPNMVKNINSIRKADQIPFLATDRNVINIPALGKSNTYRTIGITNDGRRILRFEFDSTRQHSPVVKNMEPTIIIESKSVATYLRQLQEMGENIDDYQSIWGYSAGHIELRSPVFEYL
ncbi:MAG: KamA family protein [Sphaerochaetaceae bacterium]